MPRLFPQQASRGGQCYEHLCFCSRSRSRSRRQHILITLVGMTLLIVSYGVNTVQMSAEPSRNKVVSSVNNSGIYDNNNDINGDNEDDEDDDDYDEGEGNNGHTASLVIIMNGSNEGNAHLLQIALPSTPGQDGNPNNAVAEADIDGEGRQSVMLEHLRNFRKSRLLGLFGLLGTNFSLAYNLTVGGSNTAANITVAAAPAPVYYYAPAPYAYDYYNPYAYNPYAYNPYAYNPYAYNPHYYG